MKVTSFEDASCPVALGLERVGEWWSILILRDAFHGMARFDEFQRNLGISTNSLTNRLNSLVESGLLEKRPYQTRPVRFEYVLTDRGRDFWPVIVALYSWGAKHFPPQSPTVYLLDAETGRPVEPVLVDAPTGNPVDRDHAVFAPGPGASPQLRAALQRATTLGVA
jgi:DNA-binding HxlR family transcriptional regulator